VSNMRTIHEMYAAFGGGDIPSIISSLGAGLPASKCKAEPSVAPDYGRQGHFQDSTALGSLRQGA
jgi:hypothetical protein